MANPYVCISATTGQPLPERSDYERAEARERIAAKAKAQAFAMDVQRQRIARLHATTYKHADNDNVPATAKAAA